jgi:hypothetical protein
MCLQSYESFLIFQNGVYIVSKVLKVPGEPKAIGFKFLFVFSSLRPFVSSSLLLLTPHSLRDPVAVSLFSPLIVHASSPQFSQRGPREEYPVLSIL